MQGAHGAAEVVGDSRVQVVGSNPDVAQHARLDYFTIWQDVWRAVSSYRVRAKFLADPSQLPDAVSGLLMTPRFLGRAASSVVRRPSLAREGSPRTC